ncbi:hypothetical protein [Tessaracoccus sp. ZS01]|uniref:hypothetical protein n=1 Tax=Tessaracoccus sp. ZS01 TaxID=1906324 RepID=UPI00130174EB|nr:hypothetical protein [Tessaracoccus sp. ZS01]
MSLTDPTKGALRKPRRANVRIDSALVLPRLIEAQRRMRQQRVARRQLRRLSGSRIPK